MPGSARRGRINQPAKRHPSASVIANGRHRFGGTDRPIRGETSPRFPVAKQGYDPAIVDQRFAELEQEVIELDRELANLQASTPLRTEAAAETDQIGKHVSAILIAAHESAGETRRIAEAEADRRIADAESRARSITADGHHELRRLQDEMTSLQRERNQLLGEIRRIADGLRALADKPAEDVPTESVHDSSGA
jgi:cell division septum initiation protein DivIVA